MLKSLEFWTVILYIFRAKICLWITVVHGIWKRYFEVMLRLLDVLNRKKIVKLLSWVLGKNQWRLANWLCLWMRPDRVSFFCLCYSDVYFWLLSVAGIYILQMALSTTSATTATAGRVLLNRRLTHTTWTWILRASIRQTTTTVITVSPSAEDCPVRCRS